jgi:hypothetical protein
MDCFAALAMTWRDPLRSFRTPPAFQFCNRSHVHIQIPCSSVAIYSAAKSTRESQRKLSPMAEAAKSRSEAAAALPTWPDEIYRVLKDAGIRQVAMVPDAGHSRLIRSFEADPGNPRRDADDGGRGRGDAGGRLAWRRARRAAVAI